MALLISMLYQLRKMTNDMTIKFLREKFNENVIKYLTCAKSDTIMAFVSFAGARCEVPKIQQPQGFYMSFI